MDYELLIKFGTIIDPAQGVHALKDVAFANGMVIKVGDDLSKTKSPEIASPKNVPKFRMAS